MIGGSGGTIQGDNITLELNSANATDKLTISGGTSGATTLSVNTISLQKGTLEINGGTSGSSAQAQSIIIGSSGTASIKGKGSFGVFNQDTVVNAEKSSTISLESGGKISFGGTTADAKLNGKKLVSNGGTLDFSTGNGSILVVTGFADEENDIYTDPNESGALVNINVDAGKTATFALNSDKDENRGVFHIGSGSVIDLKSASSSGGGILAIQSGGATSNKGSIVVIEDGATITSTGVAGSKSPYISVKGASNSDSILKISDNTLVSFLKSDKPNEAVADDIAGSIELQADSELDIVTEKVVNLISGDSSANKTTDFTNNGELNLAVKSGTVSSLTSAGIIQVSGSSTIKTNHIKIGEQLSGGAFTNLNTKSKTLVLGSESFDSSRDALNFGTARVSDKLTFVAKSGEATNTFYLQDDVKLNRNYFVDTEPTCNTSSFALNTPGIVENANLNVSGNGLLTAESGIWSFDKNVTITSGTVSVATAVASSYSSSYLNGQHAILSLTGDVKFAANSGDIANATLKAIGTSGANAVLDLTKASLTTNESGEDRYGVIEASGDVIALSDFSSQELKDFYEQDPNSFNNQVGWGTVRITHSQLEDILKLDASGASVSQVAVNLKKGGLLQVSGFNTSSFEVQNFQSGDSSITSGDAAKISFSGGGTLDLGNEGILNLNAYADESAKNNTQLSIDKGTIYVGSLNLDTYDKRDEATRALAQSSTIKDGTFYLSNSLATQNSKLDLGDASSAEAKIYLDAGLEGTGTISVASDSKTGMGGVINILNGSSSLNVDAGSWNAANVDIDNKGTVSVGYEFISSLTADNYNGQTGSTLTVNELSKATFNTTQFADSNKVNISGHLLINGRDDIAQDSKVDPTSAKNAYKTAGIDFNQASITVDKAGAILEFGAKATAGVLDLTNANTADDASKNLAFVQNGIGDAQYTVTNFGQVKFNFADGTKLDKDDVKALSSKILNSSKTGYLNLANADLQIKLTARQNQTGFYDADWTDLKDFAQVIGGKATTDKLLKTLVSVNSTEPGVRGHYGALKVTDAVGPTGSLTIDGPSSLHNAQAFGGYFVFTGTESAPTAGNVQLTKDGSLALANGGIIGSITGYASTGDKDTIDGVGALVEDGLVSGQYTGV